LNGKIAFAGVGEANPAGPPARSALELAAEAALAAMDDAGVTPPEVDGILTASPQAEPHFMFSTVLAEFLGLRPRLNATLQVAGASPCLAVLHAARAIAGGLSHTVLVCESDSRGARFTGDKAAAMRAARAWTDDYEDPFGLTTPAKYALIARRHMHRFGTRPEHLAAVAVAARRHAQRHPQAPKRDPLTVEAVLASPMVADPLHVLDCCPVMDWGGAALLTSAERGRDLRKPPVLLLGGGEGHNAFHLHELDELPGPALRASAEAAFGMAGVRPADIHVAQLFDAFTITITVLLSLEELGFCRPGEAGPFVAEGRTEPDGSLPVNTWGGMLTWGNAHIQVVPEAVRQLRGEAGGRQVPGARLAVAHGAGGPLAVSCTLVLGI
jgi:acetyl-CoA acetyltransferase